LKAFHVAAQNKGFFRMTIAILLIILLSLLIFRHWEMASRLASVVDGPNRFFYVSTATRRLMVVAGFCLLALVVVGGVAAAIHNTLWQKTLDEYRKHSWVNTVLLGAVTSGTFLLFALPPLRPLVRRLRYFLLRHLFFPTLPSCREEGIIRQLMAGKGFEYDLDSESGSAAAMGGLGDQTDDLQAHFDELTRLHEKLQKTVGNTLGGKLLFGKEWEMADSIFQSVCRQMALPVQRRNVNLHDKIHCCLYYSYRLMADYVFVTGFTRWQQLCKFRWFGYRVSLPG
jgi:hypothetical protein